MNNKGQSLVLFVLLIPILIGIIALTVDLGNAWTEKNNLDNITEIVMDYSLDKKDDNYILTDVDIIKLMNYNTKKEISNVEIKDNTITIESNTYINGIFSKMFKIKGFKIISKYKGYIENNKKKIQKEI